MTPADDLTERDFVFSGPCWACGAPDRPVNVWNQCEPCAAHASTPLAHPAAPPQDTAEPREASPHAALKTLRQ